jgi:hypothetical protein
MARLVVRNGHQNTMLRLDSTMDKEMTRISIRNCLLDETIPLLIQWPKLHVQSKVPMMEFLSKVEHKGEHTRKK